jgi:putative phosphoesterase
MIIGILSDTHDKLERTRVAVGLLKEAGAEALFHCGDITQPPLIDACRVLPCHYVLGNNDCDMAPHLKLAVEKSGGIFLGWGGEVTLAGKRIAMAHGHLTRDLRPLLLAEPSYLLSGHSHIASDSGPGPLRRINPGALHRAKQFTVALLNLATDELQFLTVPR